MKNRLKSYNNPPNMIKIQRITTADSILYNYMEQLMIYSFPCEEYRSLEELRKYTDHKANFYNNIIFNDDTPIGLVTYWYFETFYYVEHFAIDQTQRNGGYGKSVLNHLCQLLKLPIILEVEEPKEEMAQRRIGFYQRHGFCLSETPYLQPPYRKGDDYLPMRLMTYNLACNKELDSIKNKIYREVYNIK